MRLLGIDFGLKKIGLAMSEGGIMDPLLVIENSKEAFQKISSLCQEHEIEQIVVGLPKGKLVPQIKEFGEKLASLIKLPVVFQDETLTSKLAIAKMIEAGKGRMARREKEDAIAAALILQDYLEKNV